MAKYTLGQLQQMDSQIAKVDGGGSHQPKQRYSLKDLEAQNLPEYKPKSIPQIAKPKISPWETAITSAAKGATFGYLPQIYGGLAALIPGGQGYTEARDSAAAALKESEGQNQKTAFSAELGGGMLLPGGASLKGAKTAGQVLKSGALAGGFSGLITNPGETKGEISPLQLKDRLGGGLTGAAFGGAIAPIGRMIGQKAQTSRLANRLTSEEDLVQDELKKKISDASGLIRKHVIDPAEEEIQWVIKGKQAALNPDLIPSQATNSPITGRPILGNTKKRLQKQATREVLEPGKMIDVDEAGRKSAASDIDEQNLSFLPEETKPAFNNQNIPGTTTKNIFAPKAEVSDFPQWSSPTVKQPAPTQQGMRMQEMQSRSVQDLTTDVPLPHLREMMKTAGGASNYARQANQFGEKNAASSAWENFRNILSRKIKTAEPKTEPLLKKESLGYGAMEGIEQYKKSPISKFGTQEGKDPRADFRRADRLIQQQGVGESGGLIDLLNEYNAANRYNRPLSLNLMQLPETVVRALTQRGLGWAGRAARAETQLGNEAYRKLLMSLAAERARAATTE